MNFFKHLHTINHHRYLVFKTCSKIGIFYQGLVHDLSKYSFKEFINGVKYFEGFRSPTEKEREVKGFSEAWLHHKAHNKHHLEYWYDINPNTKKYEPIVMPIKYLKEMFADRIAASKTYLKENYTSNSPYEYFVSHKARDIMNIKSATTLESWLKMLGESGEYNTFKYLRGVKEYEN